MSFRTDSLCQTYLYTIGYRAQRVFVLPTSCFWRATPPFLPSLPHKVSQRSPSPFPCSLPTQLWIVLKVDLTEQCRLAPGPSALRGHNIALVTHLSSIDRMLSAHKLCKGIFWQMKYIFLLLSHGEAHLSRSAPRLFTFPWQSPVHHKVNTRSNYYGQMALNSAGKPAIDPWKALMLLDFRPPCEL